MKETDKFKAFGRWIGRIFAVVFVSCTMALMLGGTVAILRMLF